MGVGKTTVARTLSDCMGLKMIDLDDSISQESGMAISEIFSNKGEAHFRQEERTSLKSHILTEANFVMSTGGGTPCFHQNIELMKDAGIVVWLDLPADQIHVRLKNDVHTRPLISGLNDQELIDFVQETLAERSSIYAQAHLRIQPDANLNIEALAKEIKAYCK